MRSNCKSNCFIDSRQVDNILFDQIANVNTQVLKIVYTVQHPYFLQVATTE